MNTHTPNVAIFDVNEGFLQWVGEASDDPSAINRFISDVGLWDSEDSRLDQGALLTITVTDKQAAALLAWAESGHLSSEYPEDLGAGTVYTEREVREFLEIS